MSAGLELNQIEKQFNSFMAAVYGKETISEAQKKDLEKTFYAGMLACFSTIMEYTEKIDGVEQLGILYKQIFEKMEELKL